MELLKPELGLIFWSIIIVLGVFIILRKYAWRPILFALEEREIGISKAIEQANKAKLEMAQLQTNQQDLLNEAREERSKLLRESRDLGDTIIMKAREKATLEGNRIVSDFREQIQNEQKAAIIAIKNEIGTLSVLMAEQILKKELANKEEQIAYIQRLVQQAPKSA